MSVGKYSPTVSSAYHWDQGWWERNGGQDPANKNEPYAVFYFDRDGYDEYGYSVDEIDRAGNTETDYLTTSEWQDDELIYTLYDDVERDWSVDDDKFPARISTAMV